ncbi:hypothetical protein B0T16DRAFT_93800 [Cercophora newfieldiana]|uniref:Uncharacterized protein n=1 Tax=Cercophora newfieldiana TaxID=92897 RepID=A0AA40CVF1_9PEZI|nr:hypothetical protein B0T16DRAFT_93800 [Cercophora newfieldiana]
MARGPAQQSHQLPAAATFSSPGCLPVAAKGSKGRLYNDGPGSMSARGSMPVCNVHEAAYVYRRAPRGRAPQTAKTYTSLDCGGLSPSPGSNRVTARY